jgi:fibronectin-binding autotransporter adhesin
MAVLGMNEGNEKYINFDLSGTVNTQVVHLEYGTVSTLGTLPNLPGGSIVVTNGTIASLPTLNITSGSLAVVAGTGVVSSGSIAMVAGTVTAGTLTNLVSGTINSATCVLGTLPGVGVVSVLTNGTIGAGTVSMGAGTITAGTLTNLVSGTINSATCVLGTLPGVGVVSVLTNGTIGAGTIAVSAGTMIMTAGTVAAGTIAVSAGTITHGTIDAGTVKLDGRAGRSILSYGTTFVGTAGQYGTLVGSAGVGTSIWVNDVSVVNSSGTLTALVGFGTALSGSSVLVKGLFGVNGGIQKSYPLAVNAGMTNNDLVCYTSAAGTIDVCCSYFISA